jgi:2,3-bisphosphoglycerate-independent phosphoglycerate mutase
MEPVPFMLYSSDKKVAGVDTLTEKTAEECNNYIPDGTLLMEILTNKN